MFRLPTFPVLIALLAGAVVARGQVAFPPSLPTQGDVEIKRMTVYPAVEPRQALRYRLLPTWRDMKPGNALLWYFRAFSPEAWIEISRDKDFYHKVEKWQTMPLKDLVASDAGDWITRFRALEDVDRGARRQSCDWELMERLRTEGMAAPLADLQPLRTLEGLLSVRARLEIAAGKFDKAIFTLQTGFALAKHCGEGPTFIHALVGHAMGAVMLARVEEWIQQPGAPNLYWALTALPPGLIDIHNALQGEEAMAENYLPELQELEKGPMSLQRAREAVEAVVKRTSEWTRTPNSDPGLKFATAAWIALAYPHCKDRLLAAGYRRDWLEAAPTIQVVLLDTLSEFHRVRDDMFKGFLLPFAQAQTVVQRAAAASQKAADDNSQNTLLRMLLSLLPAVEKVHLATGRMQRRIDSLRVLEAVRVYAAEHGGRPPATLADLAVVVVPQDPISDKPFGYEANGASAVLSAPLERGLPRGGSYAWRYEVTFGK